MFDHGKIVLTLKDTEVCNYSSSLIFVLLLLYFFSCKSVFPSPQLCVRYVIDSVGPLVCLSTGNLTWKQGNTLAWSGLSCNCYNASFVFLLGLDCGCTANTNYWAFQSSDFIDEAQRKLRVWRLMKKHHADPKSDPNYFNKKCLCIQFLKVLPQKWTWLSQITNSL